MGLYLITNWADEIKIGYGIRSMRAVCVTAQFKKKTNTVSVQLSAIVINYYIRQVNVVKLADIMFSFLSVRVCVCVSVRTWLQCSLHNTLMSIAPIRLKLRTSNLTSTSTGTVRTWPLRKFSKRGRGQGHVTRTFLGVKCQLLEYG